MRFLKLTWLKLFVMIAIAIVIMISFSLIPETETYVGGCSEGSHLYAVGYEDICVVNNSFWAVYLWNGTIIAGFFLVAYSLLSLVLFLMRVGGQK